MVLIRTALEKLNKEELISLFIENDYKLNSNITILKKQRAEVNEASERMESQLGISKTINNTLEKHITSLEKQCWRNEQCSRCECVENRRILDSNNETKVCELIGKVTGINVNQECLESCHPLPSDKKNKIIVKVSNQKDAKSILQNKNKDKNFNSRSIDIDSTKSLSMKVFVTTTSFFGVSAKSCRLKSGLKLFG